MGKLVLVCIGGAVGTGARFLVVTWAAQRFGADFPRGTIAVNVTGSFLIAVVLELSTTTAAVSPTTRLFLTAGVMGGYTTYSSFNHETLGLATGGAYDLAAWNLLVTVPGCLVAGALGVIAARALARPGGALAPGARSALTRRPPGGPPAGTAGGP